jgi:hypothetical protein
MGDLVSDADKSIFCSTCEVTFEDWNKLNWHAQSTLHLAFPCDSPNCNEAFSSSWQLQEHRSKPHVLVHANVAGLAPFVCMECLEQCQGKVDLLRHAKQHQHQPYACQCGSRFSRSDVLDRHLKSFGTDEPKHPCKYCKRHRGPQGFKRLDHLMQHIRNYHHHDTNDGLDGGETSRSWTTYNFPVCTHSDCPQYRDESFKRLPRAIQKQNKPFDSQSAYAKHMREEHNDSTFPCDVLGCQRVGRKGYFREKDLLRHRSEQHPEAPPYQVQIREWKIRCTEVGCNSVLSPTFIRDHMFRHRNLELMRLSSASQHLQLTQSLEDLEFSGELGG